MDQMKAFTLGELAKFTDSELIGDPNYRITGYANLESACENDISFLSDPRYTNTRYVTAMKQSRAGAIFISPKIETTEGRNFLINEDPSNAFQVTIETMRGGPLERTYFESVHQSAVIHETAKLGSNVAIGPNAVIDANTVIGENTFIGAGAYIGPETEIGNSCVIEPNVTIREYCQIGNNVIIQSGCVIGSWGFGYSTDEKGIHTRINQLGTVVIEDDVEIAANCTVDRARFTETRIGQGTKIDNVVVIGHNVQIGKHNLICGQSAVAGSTTIGNHVVIAGQCGVDGHLNISDGVIVTAKSGVTKSLPPGRYGGYPAQPLDQFNKTNVYIRQMGKHVALIKELKARLEKLEEKTSN